MIERGRVISVPLALLALAGSAILLGAGAPARGVAPPLARVAGSIGVRDEGRLHLVTASGSLLIDEGTASGTFPGKVRVRFTYSGNPSVSAQITIYGHAGSIVARASGRLSSPTSSSPSFKGALTIVGGSGRYARAHGEGELFGVFYRRSYAITVQTRGTLRY